MTVLLGSEATGGSARGPQNNKAAAQRFECTTLGVVTAIHLNVHQALEAGGLLEAGVFEGTASVPTRLLGSGAVSVTTAGVKEATIPGVTVEGGWYWLGYWNEHWTLLEVAGAEKAPTAVTEETATLAAGVWSSYVPVLTFAMWATGTAVARVPTNDTAAAGLAVPGVMVAGAAGSPWGPSSSQGDGEVNPTEGLRGEVSPTMRLGVSNPNPDESE